MSVANCFVLLTQVGEGEKMVRALFAVARELQPSIIFIGTCVRSLYVYVSVSTKELL